jgi:hypothetical protein
MTPSKTPSQRAEGLPVASRAWILLGRLALGGSTGRAPVSVERRVRGHRGRDRERDRLKASLELPVVPHVVDGLKPVVNAGAEAAEPLGAWARTPGWVSGHVRRLGNAGTGGGLVVRTPATEVSAAVAEREAVKPGWGVLLPAFQSICALKARAECRSVGSLEEFRGLAAAFCLSSRPAALVPRG